MPLTTWQRLNEMIDLLVDSYPNGVTTTALAERLDVSRQTTHKDITRLSQMGIPVEDAKQTHHYTINPRNHIRPLRLTLPQAWQLYLPLRQIVRAQRHENPLVHSLLKRLAITLDDTLANQLIPEGQPVNAGADAFIQLVDAWRDQRLVEVFYQPPNGQAKRHLIAPYWFEPAVWTDGTYLIAGLQQSDGFVPVTLKLNRILQAASRLQTFERPAPERILERLQQTWGIWLGDEPVTVRLRFANRVRQRLTETRWHPTEQLTDEADGSVMWAADVEEPQEMLPWIRGWGPDVEVLEPTFIRDEVAIAADRTARLYGFCEGEDDSYF